MKLYKHQIELLKLRPQRHLLAWSCGTGKTCTAIKLIEEHDLKTCLVLCPKSLKENWKNEISKFQENDTAYTILSKEEFKKEFKKNTLKVYDGIIIDECHFWGGMKSELFKSTYKYVSKNQIRNRYLLSATPYLSTPFNIYCLFVLLGFKVNFIKFKNTFFRMQRMGGRFIPIIKPNMQKEIAEIINQIGSTVKLEDCVDLPDAIFKTEYFDLTSEQRKAMEEIDEFLPIVLYTKYHQICGGTLADDFVDKFIPCEKKHRLSEWIDQNDKLIIVCRYNAEIKMIAEILREKKRFFLMVNGESKNVSKIIDEANQNSRCILLINAKCSAGFNLPTFSKIVFYSLDFSLVNFLQMLGRIQRITNPQKCVYIFFVCKNTIDEDVYKSISKKEDFDIAIFARQNKRLTKK